MAGSFTLWFLVGFLFWAIWGIWILLDIFFVGIWVEDLNAFASETEEDDYEGRLKKVDALYELYQKGAISKEEFEARKEILMRD